MSFPKTALKIDTGETCAYCNRTAAWGVFGVDDVANVQTCHCAAEEKARHLLYHDGIGEQVCTPCLQKIINKKM